MEVASTDNCFWLGVTGEQAESQKGCQIRSMSVCWLHISRSLDYQSHTKFSMPCAVCTKFLANGSRSGISWDDGCKSYNFWCYLKRWESCSNLICFVIPYTTASHEPVIETWDITEAVDKAVEAVELCGSLYFGLKEVLLFLKKG